MIFNIHNRSKAIEYIDNLFEQGKEVLINIYRKPRSISSNNLMWLWLTCIERETGNDRNWMKQYYQEKFLTTVEYEIKTFKGTRKATRAQGTSELDNLQFSEFLKKIKQDAEEEFTTEPAKPFTLPNPDDIKFKHFAEYYRKYI